MKSKSRKPLTDAEGEVREILAEDIAEMRPAEDVLPPELVVVLPKRRPGQRGPGKERAKQLVTLRIKPDVIHAFRTTGHGWQARMGEVLEKNMPKGPSVRSREDGRRGAARKPVEKR